MCETILKTLVMFRQPAEVKGALKKMATPCIVPGTCYFGESLQLVLPQIVRWNVNNKICNVV